MNKLNDVLRKEISKKDISLIRSLKQKKYRNEYSMFVCEGEKIVEEACQSDMQVLKVFRTEDIGEDNMKKISHQSSVSPILALVKKPEIDPFLSEFVDLSGVSIALDHLSDPGNMGTIIRLADWFGINHIFASEDTVDAYNNKVIQSSMGAIFRKHICYQNINNLCDRYLAENGKVYGTFLEGDNIYQHELNTQKALIVMGSENNGISSVISKKVTDKLNIPPYPINEKGSESLNVAMATAIVFSEFRRR
ncbi:MAG: RNA methyltransferase [Bacteroidales bacterium]